VLALLILIMSPVMILHTPTDIFPSINIPVVAVAWIYTGLNPEEMEGRVTTVYERLLTTLVDNIEHIESTTVNGTAIVKIYLQPNASIDRANAEVTAASQTILRQLPPGSLPPLIINYNASTVPILFRSEGLRVGAVRGDHAELVPITIGRDYGSTVEVVNGLKPTDQVIVNPSDSLTTGTPVRIDAPQAGGSQ
jgi:hypothetical protein